MVVVLGRGASALSSRPPSADFFYFFFVVFYLSFFIFWYFFLSGGAYVPLVLFHGVFQHIYKSFIWINDGSPFFYNIIYLVIL